jgi:cytochrome c553
MRKWVMAGLIAAFASAAASSGRYSDWAWLFPFAGPSSGDVADGTAYRLPGSARSFTDIELSDLKHTVDWFPAEHPPMPDSVAAGHDGANACGYCHLPDGNGRPENSALAGLPADYIKRQVAAFADGSRRAVVADAFPVKFMTQTAKGVTPGEVDQAAAYFSKLRYTSHVRVVETAEAGFHPSHFIYVLAPGARQPIGDRIIEVPVDPVGFERRDPHMHYVAFVPPGSIAAGRTIAISGGPAGQPCAICHGEGLRGGIAPALAGRSPTMLVRQLAAFQSGARSGPETAPMQAVAAHLEERDMVAVAAYAATLRP